MPSPLDPVRRPWGRSVLAAAALAGLVCAAYLPTARAGFPRDDDSYVTENRVLRDAAGLVRLWTHPRSVPQWYPLTHTTFWAEYQLWGLAPLGYHAVNVALHAVAAVLLWRLLLRLGVPGAYLAAAIFAVHPVCVESVAWITERKNVLSMVFALGAALAYLRFERVAAEGVGSGRQTQRGWHAHAAVCVGMFSDEATTCPGKQPPANNGRAGSGHATQDRCWAWYAAAALLFLCALASKTVVATLPAALAVMLWWKRGRLTWREAAPLAPLLVVGIGMGLFTAYAEKFYVGAVGRDWSLTPPERVLVAGRAVAFYAAKLAWPHPLVFMYPRWEIDAAAWRQWLYPAGVAAVLAGLWALRHRLGRGPLAAGLIYAGALFPALGFVDVYPFRYSFVADHFQYHAAPALIALAVAAAVAALRRAEAWWGDRQSRSPRVDGGGTVTRRCVTVLFPARQDHCHATARDSATLARGETQGAAGLPCRTAPPLRLAAWFAGAAAVACLGTLTWFQCGMYRDLETLWATTIRRNPGCWMAVNNLGMVHARRGDMGRALIYFRESIRLNPDYPNALANAGALELGAGRPAEALALCRRAVAADPKFPDALNNLGNVLAAVGRPEEAEGCFLRALAIVPTAAPTHYNLGNTLVKLDRPAEAIASFARAVELNPDYTSARINLALVLIEMGRVDEGLRECRETLRREPSSDAARRFARALVRNRRPAEAAELYQGDLSHD